MSRKISKLSKPDTKKNAVVPAYATALGQMYQGKSEKVLSALAPDLKGKVQLLFTSPPYPLRREKRYGNLRTNRYVNWFASYAPLFRQIAGKHGSVVIELGNGWERGRPTMSTLGMEALLAFKEAGRFYLCQEFIWLNPARLPSPVQWVNVKRSRVKDAFTRIWWMSASPEPKADNRKVLADYSDSMKKLLERGTYNSGKRPSEHHIGGKSFLANNGGAIPPNVLVPSLRDVLTEVLKDVTTTDLLSIANTASGGDAYQAYCRANPSLAHPARMPSKLVQFFVQFLTDPGDLVLDPFAGSNTTGAAAEEAGRRWISIEADKDYVKGSEARFFDRAEKPQSSLDLGGATLRPKSVDSVDLDLEPAV